MPSVRNSTCLIRKPWKKYKLLSRKESTIPFVLESNGDRVFSEKAKADTCILNKHFFNDFNHTNSFGCHPKISPIFASFDQFSFPGELLSSVDKVQILISSLNPNKSTGADNILQFPPSPS